MRSRGGRKRATLGAIGEALGSVWAGGRREWLASLARKFIDINRRHLVVEEESFFPLALRVLGPEDWAEIDAQVTDREDPLFGGAVEERVHALHESILALDRAGGKSRHAE